MKNAFYILLLFLLFSGYRSGAQVTLNPAVDTAHNKTNAEVIRNLTGYLDARLHKKDGKAFWVRAETDTLKTYDFYEAHSSYEISFDNIIVLGITQPESDLYKVKVLFGYTGTDKVKTIWSVDDFFLVKQNNTYKLCNALFQNMRMEHYKTVSSPRITYHFPAAYAYQQAKVDSANHFLNALEQFFNKPITGKIEYVTAPTCENLYAVLGSSFQAGTMSSTTTFCGYFDMYNKMIITSGGEYYKHELLRTLNLIYPDAPDLLKSGITCLWGGTANKPVIYHIKKLYPYLLSHPEVFNKLDDFYYFDDETNPQFIFETIVINYVLKHEGREGLLKLMPSLKNDISIEEFLKDHYQITDLRTFFLNEFKYYSTRNRLEFDNLLELK